jgi:hypothetical protein
MLLKEFFGVQEAETSVGFDDVDDSVTISNGDEEEVVAYVVRQNIQNGEAGDRIQQAVEAATGKFPYEISISPEDRTELAGGISMLTYDAPWEEGHRMDAAVDSLHAQLA